MDNQLLTLSKIFTERLFRIPDYQRGYAWSEKQLKDFWSDVQQLGQDSNHYTGVLTLEKVPFEVYSNWDEDFWIIKAKSYQPYFVVDGQQRLTTTIILIQSILEKVRPSDNLNYTARDDIQRKFIFDSKDSGISRSYIFGYEKDNPSYEFLKTKIFGEFSSSSSAEETIYTQNLEYAKAFFVEKIADLSHSDVELLFKKVSQQLLFNIFTITEDVDVCVAFETMNNRGKPLSYLELLKNRLIYLSLKFDADDFERRKLRTAINDCWKAIYHNLGRNKSQPLDDDLFLSTHYYIYFGEKLVEGVNIEEARTYRRLFRSDYADDLLENRFIPRNIVTPKSVENKITLSYVYNYVSSLQDAVQTWYKIWNPLDSNFNADVKIWLDKLNRIGSQMFHPLVLVFLQMEQEDSKRVAFLKAIERHLFILSLTGDHYGYRFAFGVSFDALRGAIELRSGRLDTDKAAKYISGLTSALIKDSDLARAILARFRSEGFYNWDGIRYFLFEYNLELHKRSKTNRPKIHWPEFNESKDDYLSIEHIYPQQARDDYWTSRFGKYGSKQKSALRDSLGNLLPLSKPKNSSLSNRPFPDKVDGKKDPVVGYRYGCYAENEVAKEKEWTPEHILLRGIKLLEFMEHRWGIEFGDLNQKKMILGLEFIKDS